MEGPETVPAQRDLEALAAALKVLAHPKRLRLLKFLEDPHYLEEIASELGVARQSAQEHLDQLLALGMVRPVRGRRDHGPVTEYVVALPSLFEVHEQLGARLGLLDVETDERVHLPARTTTLDVHGGSRGVDDMPRVTIVHGIRLGHTTVLDGAGPWSVGRDPHSALCLDYDPFASSRHAEIRRAAAGGFEIVDAFSSNGTFVDWKRLPRGGAAPLPNGALLRIGKSLILFRGPSRG